MGISMGALIELILGVPLCARAKETVVHAKYGARPWLGKVVGSIMTSRW